MVMGRRLINTYEESRPTFSESDSDFWDLYNGLGADYRRQLDPYLSYNYDSGLWDKVGNFLGFNTAEDRYRFQMQDRARQALAGLYNDQFQNSYNSASAQASRQRDAGLNPDLAGQTEGESAAGLEQPMSPIDPSIFGPAPSEILVDVASLFGSAASGLSSVAQFTNLLAQQRKAKAETSGVQISNASEAWNYAGKYLSAFDPKTRIDYADIETNPTFFQDVIVPAKISSLRERLPGLDEDAYKLIERQIKARQSDPSLMEAYYKSYKAATESRTAKLASQEVHGSLDLADDVIQRQNSIILEYQIKAIEFQLETNSIISEYNSFKASNDLDFEKFKMRHNLPLELVETDLQGYLTSRAQSQADKLRAEQTKAWLTYLNELRGSGDPAATYLLNAMLQGGYAPLMNTSVNAGVGPFKGGGSWQNYIVPGMKTPQDGFVREVNSTYDPDNPYSWQNQKH